MSLSRVWLWLAVLLPILGALLAGLATVDLAYQIRAGGEFLDSGVIPAVDTYTFTVAGQPWLNQQWLIQIVLALVHRVGGWELLHVLRAALVGLIFGLVLRACLSRGATPRTAALVTLAAFAVAAPALALRPQLFGMALFAASVLVVAERRRVPRARWLLVPIAAVWTNVHGSFVLLPALLGVAWLQDLVDRAPGARTTFLVGVVATAATLLNPWFAGAWSYAVGLSTDPLVSGSITEWQPTTLRTLVGLLFFGSVAAVVVLLVRAERVSWPTLLWLGILAALGAYAVRGVAWWPIGAASVVAGLLAAPADGLSGIPARPVPRPRPVNAVLVGVLAIAIVALLPWWRPVAPDGSRQGLLQYAPAGLTSRLDELAGPDDRLFAAQVWAPWFELTVPQAPVFVDARFELFGGDVWADYVAVVTLREDWRALLDEWGVTIAVVDDATMREFGDRLAEVGGWSEAYADSDGRIFVRVGS